MSLKRENREYDPWSTGTCFVLAKKLIAEGIELSFGDPYPQFCNIAVMHTHFNNGVIGTQEELTGLKGHSVQLFATNDYVMPVAMFIADPLNGVLPQDFNPNVDLSGDDEEGTEDKFYMENAELLKGKKDLIGYAREFGIRLPNKTTVSIAKMLVMLKEEATKKGLLE